MFLLKNPFFMFLADFNFSISHLKKHPAVHLNTSKALHAHKKGEKSLLVLERNVLTVF